MNILIVSQWKQIFWSLIILFDSNSNGINSSSFSSLWLHYDSGNMDFYNQSVNDIKQSSMNVTYEGFQGNFSTNEEFKNNKKEANSGDQSYDYDEIEQFINPSIENYTETKKSRIISHSHRRSLSTAKRCIPYSEKYLYQLLERTGMLNQWLMANNPEEAGRNFARSYKNFFKTKFDYFDSPQDDDGLPSDVDDVSLPLTCNDLCQNIIWKLNEALIKEKNDTLSLSVPFLDDAQPHIINTSLINSSSNCQSGMFIPIGKCIPQGAEEFDDHSKLCTSCHGVYMLGKMCFPRFINAVRCESQIQTSGCIFDKISTQAHGSCYMRTLTLQVLRNRGDEKCHEWHHEYIQVPTSCECQLDTESILLSAVKL